MNDEKFDNLLECLNAVQGHIKTSDEKAVSLLTALGIVFSFSMIPISDLSQKQDAARTCAIAFGITYLISFAVSIFLLIAVIFPRGKRKGNIHPYSRYPRDIRKAKSGENFSRFLSNQPSEESILEQIDICSKIACRKEDFLRIAVMTISIFVFALLALVVIAFI